MPLACSIKLQKKLAWIFSALLISACVQNPLPDLKQSLPDQWRHVDALATSTPPVVDWWKSLNDPMLNEIVDLAIQNNLTLAQAKERITYARELQKEERASELPDLNFFAGPDNLSRTLSNSANGGSTAGQSQFRSTGAFLAGFDLLWELPLFGRGDAQRRMAGAGVEASQADLALKQVSLVAEVVKVYGELQAAQGRLRISETLIARYEDWDRYNTKAKEAGLLAQPDAEASRQAILEAKKAMRLATLDQSIAMQRLAVLLGLTTPKPEWANLPEASATPSVSKVPSVMPADLIRYRPDVKYAEAMVLRASGELGIARSDLYPKLTIEGALMATGRLSANSRRRTGTIAYVAPSIKIPLIDWGLTRAVVNQKDAKLREAVLAYREAVLLAIEDTENALAQLDASNQQLLQEEAEMQRLTKQAGQMQHAFESGFFSRFDLLKQEIRSVEASLRWVEAKEAWNRAYAFANKAMSSMGKDPNSAS